MKIVDIRTIPLTWNAANPCTSVGTVSAARSALVVEIETDTGLIGIGEAGVAGGPLISLITTTTASCGCRTHRGWGLHRTVTPSNVTAWVEQT